MTSRSLPTNPSDSTSPNVYPRVLVSAFASLSYQAGCRPVPRHPHRLVKGSRPPPLLSCGPVCRHVSQTLHSLVFRQLSLLALLLTCQAVCEPLPWQEDPHFLAHVSASASTGMSARVSTSAPTSTSTSVLTSVSASTSTCASARMTPKASPLHCLVSAQVSLSFSLLAF